MSYETDYPLEVGNYDMGDDYFESYYRNPDAPTEAECLAEAREYVEYLKSITEGQYAATDPQAHTRTLERETEEAEQAVDRLLNPQSYEFVAGVGWRKKKPPDPFFAIYIYG